VSFAASAPAEATPALVLSPPMAAVEVAEISVEPAADERDGCDGPILDAVPDDELPVARGGVA
jgi:hypothetical protein